MKKLMGLVLLFLLLLMVLTVLCFKLLGWSGLLVMLILLALGAMYLKSIMASLLQKAFVTPFLMKGEVLKDAVVEIHNVQPATRPARTYVQHYNEEDGDSGDDVMDVEDEGSNEYSRHFLIDVTITPQVMDSAFQYWEPGELTLVKMDAQSGELDNEDASVGAVLDVELWDEGKWVEDDSMKYSGQQRLKLLAGVRDGVRACRFRYYFEVFGHIELPEATLSDLPL